MQGDRGAEIAGDDTLNPDPELDEERRVEAVVRLERGDVGRTRARRNHHRHRIARHDAQQDEHDDCHARERQQRHGQAIGDDSK